ncbi:MAG: efflux RND transporter periplasmic adaptor subunit, partial [Chloroflexi bacterium]|nr:efflux RND transporter periplasmic adaptor subunit [Chloroflexota bacterium]
AVEIMLAPEISGKVSEVLVNEGDIVQAGDVIFRINDSLPQAQRNLAASALETAKAAAQTADSAIASAQAQYDLTLTAALSEQKTSRSSDWSATQPTEFNQPAWYFEKTEQVAAAQKEVETDLSALQTAQSKVASVIEKAASGDFLTAEKQLVSARTAFEVAQNVLTLTTSTDQNLKDSAQQTYDDTISELTSAQKAYNDAITTTGAADVLTARSDLRVAQERYDAAQDRLRVLQTGNLSLKVVAAQKSLDQVKSAAGQAKIAVQQAEANLALIDTQIGKLTISSPADGMILTRAVEPGEVVMPGSGLLTLARLSDLTITVYIPEDRYGEISLGQTANMTVDSFPGENFVATVVHISGKAEFTPRNVQTVAGRKTTVFAIKLSLADNSGKLKPGMPADVLFK